MKLTSEQPDPFDRFWVAWPRHFRKSAKARCKARWRRDGLDAKADHILAVLKLWKKKWLKDSNKYVPAPLVWLNGQQWDCELADLSEHEERMAEERREAPHSPIKPKMMQTDGEKDYDWALERIKSDTDEQKKKTVLWAIERTGRTREKPSKRAGCFWAYLVLARHEREKT